MANVLQQLFLSRKDKAVETRPVTDCPKPQSKKSVCIHVFQSQSSTDLNPKSPRPERQEEEDLMSTFAKREDLVDKNKFLDEKVIISVLCPEMVPFLGQVMIHNNFFRERDDDDLDFMDSC